ncbi:ARL2 protein, partial [Fregata magnificens]|nr:ARL2 protein [Fregata magnificens]
FKLNVWDVGGQSSLRSYWRNYFESTDGLVWVVDSGDRQRLQLCARELRGLLREEGGAGVPPGPLGPWVTGGCRGPSPPQTPGSPPQALELDAIRSHHWCIQGCSAFTGHNLLAGIDWLLDDIASRL